MEFRYKNHLAHIYIYAYDNRPEVVAKAYRSEALLVHFSKGVELAKEIGNINLVIGAFKKYHDCIDKWYERDCHAICSEAL